MEWKYEEIYVGKTAGKNASIKGEVREGGGAVYCCTFVPYNFCRIVLHSLIT